MGGCVSVFVCTFVLSVCLICTYLLDSGFSQLIIWKVLVCLIWLAHRTKGLPEVLGQGHIVSFKPACFCLWGQFIAHGQETNYVTLEAPADSCSMRLCGSNTLLYQTYSRANPWSHAGHTEKAPTFSRPSLTSHQEVAKTDTKGWPSGSADQGTCL